MATTKKYFRDHFILLLLSINAFLSLAGGVFILIRLLTSHITSSDYFVEYRTSFGIADIYKNGSEVQLIAFIFFGLIVLAVSSVLSYKAYKIHRQLAVMILALGILLLLLNIIISNALLALH